MSIFLMFTVIIVPLVILKSIKKVGSESSELIEKQETSVIRGIAAVFIIESHFLSWLYDMGEETNRVINVFVSQLGGIGVLLFFFVSGYGIYISSRKEEVNWSFLKKRFENVYLPYVLVKLVILFLFYLNGKDIDISNSILKILLVEDWFISVIILQYLSFFTLWKIFGEKKKKLLIGNLVVDCILSAIFIINQRPLRWFNGLWLFTLGLVVAEYKAEIISWFSKKFIIKCICLVGAFFISGILFAVYKDTVLWINVFKVISGCFLGILVCGILRKLNLKSKILSYIGERSMYYYIVHLNIWEFLKIIANSEVKIVLAILLTVIFTEILYCCYTRLKEMVYGKLRKK